MEMFRARARFAPSMRTILILTAAIGCATTPVARPHVALAPELAQMAFYVGSWSCKGTTFATATDPEEHWDATVEVAPEVDGSWLSVVMKGPGDNITAEHKGYDRDKKQFVHLGVSPAGSWFVLTSPGWDASHMSFRSTDAADPDVTTFTKLSDTQYSHAVATATDHGPVPVWQKVCSKRPG
jgi:hypothetical protein